MQNAPLSTYVHQTYYLAPVHIAGPSTPRVLSITRILDTYKYTAALVTQIIIIAQCIYINEETVVL